jgi:hypothetical protein
MCQFAKRAFSFLCSWPGLKFLAGLTSIIFGVLGTWLMSRRYARTLARNLLYALIFPLLFLFGQGAHVRNFITSAIKTNEDIKDSSIDMTIGLHLLFWAFFLQFLPLIIDLCIPPGQPR